MFLKYNLTVLWLAPLDSPNGQGASGVQKMPKVIRTQHEPRRFSFDRTAWEVQKEKFDKTQRVNRDLINRAQRVAEKLGVYLCARV